MKLIAENDLEDQLLPGLVSLLRDLKVDAYGFCRDDAIAPIFWSSDDISLEVSSIKALSKEEVGFILENLEPALMEAMISAGFQVIENYLNDSKGIVVRQQHRRLQ